MLSFLNPLKTILNLTATVLTVTLLAFTHGAAFRLGLSVNRNPMARTAAEVMGVAPPPPECPAGANETTKEWWERIPGIGRQPESSP